MKTLNFVIWSTALLARDARSEQIENTSRRLGIGDIPTDCFAGLYYEQRPNGQVHGLLKSRSVIDFSPYANFSAASGIPVDPINCGPSYYRLIVVNDSTAKEIKVNGLSVSFRASESVSVPTPAPNFIELQLWFELAGFSHSQYFDLILDENLTVCNSIVLRTIEHVQLLNSNYRRALDEERKLYSTSWTIYQRPSLGPFETSTVVSLNDPAPIDDYYGVLADCTYSDFQITPSPPVTGVTPIGNILTYVNPSTYELTLAHNMLQGVYQGFYSFAIPNQTQRATGMFRISYVPYECSQAVSATQCSQDITLLFSTPTQTISISPIVDQNATSQVGDNLCGQWSYSSPQLMAQSNNPAINAHTGQVTFYNRDGFQPGIYAVTFIRTLTALLIDLQCQINLHISYDCVTPTRAPTGNFQCARLGFTQVRETLPQLFAWPELRSRYKNFCTGSTHTLDLTAYAGKQNLVAAISPLSPSPLRSLQAQTLITGPTLEFSLKPLNVADIGTYTLPYSRQLGSGGATWTDTLTIKVFAGFAFRDAPQTVIYEPGVMITAALRRLTLNKALVDDPICGFSSSFRDYAAQNYGWNPTTTLFEDFYYDINASNGYLPQINASITIVSGNAGSAAITTLKPTADGLNQSFDFTTTTTETFQVVQRMEVVNIDPADNSTYVSQILEEVSFTFIPQQVVFPPIYLKAFIGLQMIFELGSLTQTQPILEVSGNIVGEKQVILPQINGSQLTVPLLDESFLGIHSGSILIQFAQEWTPIFITVLDPFNLDTGEAVIDYQWNTSEELYFRTVNFNADIVNQIYEQLNLLTPNEFYPLLATGKANNVTVVNAINWSQFVSFTELTVQSNQILANTTAVPNALEVTKVDENIFKLFDTSVNDMGRIIPLTQVSKVYQFGKFTRTLSKPFGQVKVSKINKCTITSLKTDQVLNQMSVKIGDTQEQFYRNFTDTLDVLATNKLACGEPIYSLVNNVTGLQAPSFVKLDARQTKITVAPQYFADEGTYVVTLNCVYPQYSMTAYLTFHVTVTLELEEINPQTFINTPPYFKGKLPDVLEVPVGVQYSYQLPPINDDEGDKTTVKVTFSTPQLDGTTYFFGGRLNFLIPEKWADAAPEQLYLDVSDNQLTEQYYFVIKFKQASPTPPPPPKVIILEKQEKIVPQQTDHADKYKKGSKTSRIETAEQKKEAKTSCVPSKAFGDKSGSLQFQFFNRIALEDDPNLLYRIKDTNSIQLILVKADPNATPTEFDWELERVDDYNIRINVTFSQPETISSTSYGKDIMRVIFMNTKQFLKCPDLATTDALSGKQRELGEKKPDYEMIVKVPQIVLANVANSANNIVEDLSGQGSQAGVWTSVAFNYFSGLSASYLWGGINALQLITSTALLNVVIPDEAALMFQYLKNMTKFDMFYDIYNPIEKMNYSKTEPYNENFDDLGLGSLAFYDVLGSMLVVFLFTASCQMLAPLILLFAKATRIDRMFCWKSLRAGNAYLEQDKYSVVNTWVRMCLECYLDILIACMLALNSPLYIELEDGTFNNWDWFNYISAIIFLIVLFAFTVLALYMTIQYRFQVSKENNAEKRRKNRRLIAFYSKTLNKQFVEQVEEDEKKEEEKEREEAGKKLGLSQSSSEEESPSPSIDRSLTKNSVRSKQQIGPQIKQMARTSSMHKIERKHSNIRGKLMLREKSKTLTRLNRIGPQIEIDQSSPTDDVKLAQLIQKEEVNGSKTEFLNAKKKLRIHLHSSNIGEQQTQQNQPEVINDEGNLVINSMKSKKSVKINIALQEEKRVEIVSEFSEEEKEVKQEGDNESIFKRLQEAARLEIEDEQQPITVAKQKSEQTNIWFLKPEDPTVQSAKSDSKKKKMMERFQSFKTLNSAALSELKAQKKKKKREEAQKKQVTQSEGRLLRAGEFRDLMSDDNDILKIGKCNYKVLLKTRNNLRKEMRRLQERDKTFWATCFDYNYVSSLREGLRIGSYGTLYYHIIFLARRVLLIFTAMYMNYDKNNNSLATYQVFIFMLATQINLIFQTYVRPLETDLENRLELFNENIVLVVAYHHLILIAFPLNAYQYKAFGISLIASIGFLTLVNFAIIFVGAIGGVKDLLKKIAGASRKSIKIKQKRRPKKIDESVDQELDMARLNDNNVGLDNSDDEALFQWFLQQYGDELGPSECENLSEEEKAYHYAQSDSRLGPNRIFYADKRHKAEKPKVRASFDYSYSQSVRIKKNHCSPSQASSRSSQQTQQNLYGRIAINGENRGILSSQNAGPIPLKSWLRSFTRTVMQARGEKHTGQTQPQLSSRISLSEYEDTQRESQSDYASIKHTGQFDAANRV